MSAPMTPGASASGRGSGYADRDISAAQAGDTRLADAPSATENRTGMGPGTRTDATDQSIGSLIAEVADDVSRLFRQEVELAKAELKTEATKAGKAGGMLGGAALAGYLTVLFASLTVMFALAAIMPIGWAALIVTTLWGIAAAVLFAAGRQRMKKVSPVPQQTVETLKEDAEWLRNPTR